MLAPSAKPASSATGRLYTLGPGILAAACFGVADVFAKLAIIDGSDVLTISTFRGLVSIVLMALWLRVGVAPAPHTPRQKWIALGVGVMFAGVVFGLFKAIEITSVPIGVLTYFVYPLLTGLIGGAIGIDKLSWRGVAAAVVAFFGLALAIGAEPGGLALGGIVAGLAAAGCRVAVMLVTRAKLQDADSRLTSWYTLVSSGLLFAAFSLATWNWQPPHGALGWFALVTLSLSTLVAVILLFVSIKRIGPFRTALVMNLEPLLATAASAPVLGEVITPVQALGGAIMLAALVAFQLRR
jgi:drug/metabolite transporter (DMT)-like permease